MSKTKLERAKQRMSTAFEITQLTASMALQFQKEIQAVKSTVEQDTDLSTTGKQSRIKQAEKELGTRLMQEAYKLSQMYKTNLKKAAEFADSVAYAPVPKPNATRLERFEVEMRALKTEVMLTTRPDTAQRKLNEFIDKHIQSSDDRFLANRVREEFDTFAGSILAVPGADTGKVRMELAQKFEELEARFTPDDVKEARSLIESATQAQDSNIFSLTAIDAMTASFGVEYSQTLNKPEKFFEDKPELKPADYVDEDDTPAGIARKQQEKAQEEQTNRYSDIHRKAAEIQEQLTQHSSSLNARLAEIQERKRILQEELGLNEEGAQ